MKKAIIIIFCFPFISCGQNKVENLLSSKFKDVHILCLKKNVASFYDENKNNVWQVDINNKSLRNHFMYTREVESAIYNKYFGDDNRTLKTTYDAFRVNQIQNSASKLNSLYVDENNKIFGLVSGLQAIQDSNGKLGVDFNMRPFFVVIEMGDSNKILNQWQIRTPMYDNQFYLVEVGSFFKTDKGFACSMFRENENSSGNKFLVEFAIKNNELLPLSLYDNLFLPKYHVRSKFGYGLLTFIERGDFLMFNSSNSIQNKNSGNEVELKFDQMLVASPKFDPFYGQSIDIPFYCCDFFMSEKNLNVIYKMKEKFYLCTYSSSFDFLASKELEIQQSGVDGHPLFDDMGNIIVQIKGLSSLVYIQ